MADYERTEFSIEFMNEVILVLLVGVSMPLVFIGSPCAVIWLRLKTNKEKERLSVKVA